MRLPLWFLRWRLGRARRRLVAVIGPMAMALIEDAHAMGDHVRERQILDEEWRP